MSRFLKHAEEIFATAREGGEDCEFAILVGGDGGIHVLAGSGWELEPLRLHHGAAAAYRVTRTGGRVRLEARSAAESCRLETRAAAAVRAGLRDCPQYLTTPAGGSCNIWPAGR
ncbi:MAG TPA: hypothetical protein VE959_38570 [Bryobacteraceae bacterium]|nr:hypothetical protein [Bryobacteraceae bacterium]